RRHGRRRAHRHVPADLQHRGEDQGRVAAMQRIPVIELGIGTASPRPPHVSDIKALAGRPRLPGPDHTLASRLAWITALRLGFLIVLLVATATLYLGGELARYPLSLRIVFLTIIAGFAQAVLYGAVLRTGQRLHTLAWLQ